MGPRAHPMPAAFPPARGRRWAGGVPVLAGWVVAVCCFGFVAVRLHRAAAATGQDVPGYLVESLRGVPWGRWLALMVPYSAAYLLLDAAVLTRVVSWSLVPARYRDLLPVRAAAYVLALVNEQLGKVAIALVLRRRYAVPVSAAVSSMVFIMVAEFCSLSVWAAGGYLLGGSRLPGAFTAVPWVLAAGVIAVVTAQLVLTRTARGRGLSAGYPVLRAFGAATFGRYLEVIALRAPTMVLAVGVYTVSLRWFGVPVGIVDMVGLLPVVLFAAAVPGPLRAAAVAAWVALFPDRPAQLAAFGLLQHLVFVAVNALLGLVLLGAAVRVLRAGDPATPRAGPSRPPS